MFILSQYNWWKYSVFLSWTNKTYKQFWIMIFLFFWYSNTLAVEYPDFVALVDEYSPAVVSIQAKKDNHKLSNKHDNNNIPIPENSPLHDYFRRFFDELPDILIEQQLAVGSGFIVSSDGYVVTNAHVVEDMSSIVVGLYDGSELNAQIVGKDKRSDIALLKVSTSTILPVVKIGDIRKAKVGQWVLAIGSPFGFERTATQGIISALGRNLPSDNYVSFIQTDTAINPGNSGGPLFNLYGEVIGVNSQIYSRSGGYQGVSFAIPIDIAMEVVEQIKSSGIVKRGWLGIQIQEITPALGQSFGLDKPQGALVGQVIADGPAQVAGIRVGDIITEFNNQPIKHSNELPMLVGRTRPGTKVPLKIIREAKEHIVLIQIGQLPEEDKLRQVTIEEARSNTLKRIGISITINKISSESRKHGDTAGVIVQETVADGPAALSGIRPGDIITRINNIDIHDPKQFLEIIEHLPANKPIPVLIHRSNGSLFLALTIPN